MHRFWIKAAVANGLLPVRLGFTGGEIAESHLSLFGGWREVRGIGGRHDRGQAAGCIGILRRHDLGNHAAHRDAHDVSLPVIDGVHQPGDVCTHVIEGIRRVDREAKAILEEFPPENGLPPVIKASRGARIPIVQQEDFVSAVGQTRDQLVAPSNVGATEPHNGNDFRLAFARRDDAVGNLHLADWRHLQRVAVEVLA